MEDGSSIQKFNSTTQIQQYNTFKLDSTLRNSTAQKGPGFITSPFTMVGIVFNRLPSPPLKNFFLI